jgi:hypothetical protein
MKKEILIPVLIIFIGLIFVFINIIVYITKGNSWFVKRKLKVGAMILSLTSIFACSSHYRTTCYKTAISQEQSDSLRKEDSLAIIEEKKKDSINMAENKKLKNDSIAKLKTMKGDTIIPTCYEMPAPKNNKPKK